MFVCVYRACTCCIGHFILPTGCAYSHTYCTVDWSLQVSKPRKLFTYKYLLRLSKHFKHWLRNYTFTFRNPFMLHIRRRRSTNNPDINASSVTRPFPTGFNCLPRATTKWSTTSSMGMTEGGSTHTLVDETLQTNGAVSCHIFL